MLGIPLGLLIGVISGIAFMFLILTAWSNSLNAKTILSIVAELLAIPTFWFGGPWLTTAMLKEVRLEAILPAYLTTLACTFLVIAVVPIFKLVVQMGHALGKPGGAK